MNLRNLLAGVVFLAFASGVVAADVMPPAATNVQGQYTAVGKFLDQLAGREGSHDGLTLRERAARYAAAGMPRITRSEVRRWARSPYASNQMLATADVLGALGRAAVGTSQQAQQAALLQQFAQLLAGTSNASLSSASASLSQESQAVAAGDSAAATAAAEQLQSLALQALPAGFMPSADDQAAAATMQAVSSYDWGSLFMALGQAVLAAVVGFIEGGPYGAIAGAAVSLITSAMAGDFTSQNTSYNQVNPSTGSTASLAGGVTSSLTSSLAGGGSVLSGAGGLGVSNVLQRPATSSSVTIQNGQSEAATGALPGSVGQ